MERHQLHMNQRQTVEDVFGRPAKRQRLQRLARDRMEKEKMIDALVNTRKETSQDPLWYVVWSLAEH